MALVTDELCCSQKAEERTNHSFSLPLNGSLLQNVRLLDACTTPTNYHNIQLIFPESSPSLVTVDAIYGM